jgi:hypothetical protein
VSRGKKSRGISGLSEKVQAQIDERAALVPDMASDRDSNEMKLQGRQITYMTPVEMSTLISIRPTAGRTDLDTRY